MSRLNPSVYIIENNSIIAQALFTWLNWYAFDVQPSSGTRTMAATQPRFVISNLTDDPQTTCNAIREQTPASKIVLFVDVFSATRYFNRIWAAGADAIVLRSAPYSGWIYALQTVHDGDRYTDPLVLPLLRQSGRLPNSELNVDENELELLIRLQMADDDICAELGLSHRLLSTKIRALLSKLESANRTVAAIKALSAGFTLIPQGSPSRTETGTTIEDHDAILCAENALEFVNSHPWNSDRK